MSIKEWVFGSSPECTVWIPESTISGQHCSLSKSSQGYVLRDGGSTNGTFVDGQRIRKATPIEADSNVMLGGLIALPWPDAEGASRVVRFGRSNANDYTIDAANVSSRHGEIIVGPTGTWVVVDTGSTNGIGLKRGDKFQVIRHAAMIGPNDTLLLGKLEVPVQQITPLFRAAPSSEKKQQEPAAEDPSGAVGRHADILPPNGTPTRAGNGMTLWVILAGVVAGAAIVFAATWFL